jgi:hypothetical protein
MTCKIVITDLHDYMFTLVLSTVVARQRSGIYFFAAVKNHKTIGDEMAYYIVPIVRNPSDYVSKNVIGPLSKKDFDDRTTSMGKKVSLNIKL